MSRKPFTPVINHCLLFLITMALLCVLSKFRDLFPINYALLFIWLLALLASVPSACFVVLFKADFNPPTNVEEFGKQRIQITFNLRLLRLIWTDFVWSCESLFRFRMLIFKAGIVSISLSFFVIICTNIFSSTLQMLESELAAVCSTLSCCWLYTLLTGMRFGGFSISEQQHRFDVVQIANKPQLD